MKDEILNGLKMALTKGESLQQAMQSFYNSGYDKKEIEDAARELHGKEGELMQEAKTFSQADEKSPEPSQPQPKQEEKSPQIVSNYEQPKKEHSRMMWIMVVSVLLIVVGSALAGVYFFRQQVIDFLSKIFG